MEAILLDLKYLEINIFQLEAMSTLPLRHRFTTLSKVSRFVETNLNEI